jgi:hypothetical protein
VRRAGLLLFTASIAISACGGTSVVAHTPDPCLSGTAYFNSALRKAPGRVRLPGGTPISGCLVENQPTGDLANVGSYLLHVATRLNAQARKDPGGQATIQLGYLVGAVTRGASDTHGIHTELLRRIRAAALYSPGGDPTAASFYHSYGSGYAAGRQDG